MPNYEALLKQAKQRRWEAHKEIEESRHTCYYSEGEGCSLCRNQSNCILDEIKHQDEIELQWLKRRLEELEQVRESGRLEINNLLGGSEYELKSAQEAIAKQRVWWTKQHPNLKDNGSWLDILPQVDKEIRDLTRKKNRLQKKIREGKKRQRQWKRVNKR